MQEVTSSTMTIRLDAAEKELISDYAKTFGMSLSDFVRTSILEKIEDEMDLRAWYEAKEEFDQDPVIIPAREIAHKYL